MGTTTLGFDPGVGYTLVSCFNTTPEMFRVVGTFDAWSRTFRFEAPPEKVIIRFDSPDRITSETILRSGGRDVTVESFRFTRR